MITGKKIYLRAIEREDLERLKEWRNLSEFRKNFREYREINTPMQEKWFDNIVVSDKNTVMFSICERETGQLLGCCGLCYINWIYRYADFSLYIGHEEAYIDQLGYAEEACGLLIDYAFRQLNLNKLWSELYEFDTQKIELYTNVGFKKDGYLRDNYYCDGRWWGSYIVSILHKEVFIGDQ